MLIIKCQLSYGQMKTEEFVFEYDGKSYNGFLDLSADEKPSALIVMIHGHGKTNVVEENWYAKTRSNFVSAGLAVCIWDKAGCGKSEGEYKHNQTVQSSAEEGLAAIKRLRELKIVAGDKIGLWGISRAGWICPLIIEEDKSIAFWISVSGTDSFDNYRYLLESNLRVEGRRESQIDTIMSEWDYMNRYKGEDSYEEFLKKTRNLFQDPYCQQLGIGVDNEEGYNGFVEYNLNSDFVFDKETGLRILVPEFEKTLSEVNCHVLSISGEKDSQVNWRNTIKLYNETIARNNESTLTIKILQDCNHNMQKCETGGLYEDLEKFGWQSCDGYYDTMLTWLKENRFGK